ncbi:MAG: murein L,D-transpeptidase catalytic domain family protein [Fusobacteriaceae bacterium]
MEKNIRKIFLIIGFILMTISSMSNGYNASYLYNKMSLNGKISYDIFEKALVGRSKISGLKNENMMVIIDYTKLSDEKRFYVLDLKNEKILYETLVAHGKNSGKKLAVKFSDIPNSYQSSLGFFVTQNTYIGEFGYSLRISGLEKGINSNSKERNIVIHGDKNVNEDFVKTHMFLARTLGCPAIPLDESKEIISKIKDGTLIFIIGNDENYLKKSTLIKS